MKSLPVFLLLLVIALIVLPAETLVFLSVFLDVISIVVGIILVGSCFYVALAVFMVSQMVDSLDIEEIGE